MLGAAHGELTGKSFQTLQPPSAQAGANATAASATVVVATAEGSIATVTPIWTGVDSINVTVLAKDGAVTVDNGSEAANFLESPEGVRWVSAPLTIRAEIAAQVRGLSNNVASGALHRTRPNALGHFCDAEAAVDLLSIQATSALAGQWWRRISLCSGRTLSGRFLDGRQTGGTHSIFAPFGP